MGRSESGIPIWQEDYLIPEKQFVTVLTAMVTLIYLAPLPAASGSYWCEVEAVALFQGGSHQKMPVFVLKNRKYYTAK